MKQLSRQRKLLLITGLALSAMGIMLAVPNVIAQISARGRIHKNVSDISKAEVALVLGAFVQPDGELTPMLTDRLAAGYTLYKASKVKKLLLSGDHGRTDYDEVNAMRNYMLRRGVPPEDIFLDHAGFDTHASLYRARDVFGVRSLVVVSQRFHLPRAIYIGRRLKLDVEGLTADRQPYDTTFNYLRELPATTKSFIKVAANSKPRFLGPRIAIAGDGRATWDMP